MDHQRDYVPFKNLVRRICTTLDKYTGTEDFEPLMESWWKALRHVDFTVIERRVENFLASATEKTQFPRPSQMRPKELDAPDPTAVVTNSVRDYWRGQIVNSMCFWLGMSPISFEPILLQHKDTIGKRLKELLDDVEAQERRGGRTIGQERLVQRITCELVRVHPALRTGRAPLLPAPDEASEEMFA